MKIKPCAKCKGKQYLIQTLSNTRMIIYCNRCNTNGRNNKYPIKDKEEYDRILSEAYKKPLI